MRRVLRAPFGSGIVALLFVAACLNPSAPALPDPAPTRPCVAQIMLSFTVDAGPKPDDRFVTDLAHASEVHLTFLRLAGPNLYVFSVSAASSDPSCSAALARLRAQRTVRFAALDARRRAQG